MTEYKSRPLTPFLLFSQDQRKKNDKLTLKELGKMWRKLSDGNKKTYVTEYRNAKQKYDKFLENIYGAEPLTYKSTEKTNKFSLVRLRGVFGLAKEVKPIDKEIYPGLVKVLV